MNLARRILMYSSALLGIPGMAFAPHAPSPRTATRKKRGKASGATLPFPLTRQLRRQQERLARKGRTI